MKGRRWWRIKQKGKGEGGRTSYREGKGRKGKGRKGRKRGIWLLLLLFRDCKSDSSHYNVRLLRAEGVTWVRRGEGEGVRKGRRLREG